MPTGHFLTPVRSTLGTDFLHTRILAPGLYSESLVPEVALSRQKADSGLHLCCGLARSVRVWVRAVFVRWFSVLEVRRYTLNRAGLRRVADVNAARATWIYTFPDELTSFCFDGDSLGNGDLLSGRAGTVIAFSQSHGLRLPLPHSLQPRLYIPIFGARSSTGIPSSCRFMRANATGQNFCQRNFRHNQASREASHLSTTPAFQTRRIVSRHRKPADVPQPDA